MTELKDWAEAAEAIWALIYGESMIFFRPMGPHVWNSSSTYWGTHLGDQLSSRLQGRVLKLALQNHKEPPNSQTFEKMDQKLEIVNQSSKITGTEAQFILPRCWGRQR